MQSGEAGFQSGVAGPRETGRACPYCRFPLKDGAQMAVCVACGAAHHGDCWQDNGGCAVVGCVGGPSPTVGERGARADAPPTVPAPAQRPPAPTQHHAVPVSAVPPAWPQSQPAATGGRWSSPVVVAVIVLALAVVGAATAIVLTRSGGGGVRLIANTNATPPVTASASTPTPTASSATPTVTVTTPTTGLATSSSGGPASSAGGATSTTGSPDNESAAAVAASSEAIPAGASPEQMQSEIQQMLLAWHEDVVYGDYRGAWNLLSERKQLQDGREYGYAMWVKNQSTLRPYLNPAGLQVAVERIERGSEVAQVDVTGMGWGKPGASCTEWSGITWVKYEAGAWRYDPGYSTTPQREREWKPRYSELLGGGC